ncbi:MAG TPA: FAD-binding protein, partial [Actinomycetes bacterium]|nr:FAD-binding protein [Actinomycetes bacterium]
VATAIGMRLREAPGGVDDHVLLDATSIGPSLVDRFPTIVAACRAAGIDPVTEPIPVAPAAHFSCGGVRADLSGTTSVPGLFAVGEVAGTGVHGANRLASNGVTEGLVAGHRVGLSLGRQLPGAGSPVVAGVDGEWVDAGRRAERAAAMSRWAGPLRDPAGLASMAALLAEPLPARSPAKHPEASPTMSPKMSPGSLAELEATNLHAVSWLIVCGAQLRHESRGCHRRLDAPRSSAAWLGHVEQRLRDTLQTEFVPREAAA